MKKEEEEETRSLAGLRMRSSQPRSPSCVSGSQARDAPGLSPMSGEQQLYAMRQPSAGCLRDTWAENRRRYLGMHDFKAGFVLANSTPASLLIPPPPR